MMGLGRNPESGRIFCGGGCPFCIGGHKGRHCRLIGRLPPVQMLSLCGSHFEGCAEYKELMAAPRSIECSSGGCRRSGVTNIQS